MNRRFLTIASAALAGATRPLAARGAQGPRMAVTMDDFTVLDGVLPVSERGARILTRSAGSAGRKRAMAVG